MQIPIAECKQFCDEDVMKLRCLCHYESARFAELQPSGFEGIEMRPIDFIERP
jgi:hypothetical protein